MHISHLNALRALEATLRHGSFSLAANELGITPAAVGQRVRSLELYLDKCLFIRSSSGIEPTEDALRVRGFLKDGFARLAQAFEQLKPNDAAGRLRITLSAHDWSFGDLIPISPDASNRRYFRIVGPDGSAILMDAKQESLHSFDSFQKISKYLNDIGLSAPKIFATDRAEKLMLIQEDGG